MQSLHRVCVGRKFSSDWADMRHLEFIAATILNFGLAWPGWQSQTTAGQSHIKSALLCADCMAKSAEGNIANVEMLYEIFFEKLYKVYQKTKIVHYFNNCK